MHAGFIENKIRIVKVIPESTKLLRRDVSDIHFQKDLKLTVYWKILEIGKGPSVIFSFRNKAIIRFDCFGKGDGHYHVYPDYNRIWFSEESALEQVHLTKAELKHSAQKYLDKYIENTDQAGHKQVRIDNSSFQTALNEMETMMIAFLNDIEELEGL